MEFGIGIYHWNLKLEFGSEIWNWNLKHKFTRVLRKKNFIQNEKIKSGIIISGYN